MKWNSTFRNSTYGNSTTGNSTCRNSTTGNSTCRNSTTGNSPCRNSTRRNSPDRNFSGIFMRSFFHFNNNSKNWLENKAKANSQEPRNPAITEERDCTPENLEFEDRDCNSQRTSSAWACNPINKFNNICGKCPQWRRRRGDRKRRWRHSDVPTALRREGKQRNQQIKEIRKSELQAFE